MSIAEKRREAAKEASHYIFNVVKTDWSYDALRQSEGRDREHGPPAYIPLSKDQLDRVIEWRDRTCDTASDIEDVDQAEVIKRERKLRSKSHEERARRQSQLEEDIAAARKARDVVIAERRRRRRRIELDEMKWNEGLRLWTYQRDAWTGAKLRHRAARSNKSQKHRRDTGSDMSSPVTPADALHEVVSHDGGASQFDDNQTTLSIASSCTSDNEDYPTDDDDEPVVPIMRPYLPKSNPLVASIKPSCYASIYTKVVKQGMTPAVPINLADMTKALVDGWKKDGEWPPPSTVPVMVAPAPKREKPKTKTSTKTPGTTSPTSARRLSATLTGAVKKAWNFSMHPSYHFHSKHNGSAIASTTAGDKQDEQQKTPLIDKKHGKGSSKSNGVPSQNDNDRRHSIADPLAHTVNNESMHVLQPVQSVASDPGSVVPGSVPVMNPVPADVQVSP